MKSTDLKKYDTLIQKLASSFGSCLKTVILFGSRARGKAGHQSDHDIFLVIDELPAKPLKRIREIRRVIWEFPLKINFIAKTPAELELDISPLLIEIAVEGVPLYGGEYFDPYRQKILKALKESGLEKKRVGKEWYWKFKTAPKKEWSLTWDGFHELS